MTRALSTHPNINGKESNPQMVHSESEDGHSTLFSKPLSKIQKLQTPALFSGSTLTSGPLDGTNFKPSMSNVVDHKQEPKDWFIEAANKCQEDVRFANLTTQETSMIFCALGRNALSSSFNRSQLVESVVSDDGQEITYYWSFPEPESGKAPAKTISLVDRLRQTAVKRSNQAFASDISGPRKRVRRLASASYMSESIFEISSHPIRSSIEDSSDCISDKLPAQEKVNQSTKTRQIPIEDRKRTFVYSPTPELMLFMVDYVRGTYDLFEQNLASGDCWLHPSPPAPLFDRGHHAIEHSFQWTDGHNHHLLTVNFGIVVLLVKNQLTEVQKEGYVTGALHVNRTCGNWTCCNWGHCALETVNRGRCFGSSMLCRHNPPCLTDKKCHPPSTGSSLNNPRQSPPEAFPVSLLLANPKHTRIPAQTGLAQPI